MLYKDMFSLAILHFTFHTCIIRYLVLQGLQLQFCTPAFKWKYKPPGKAPPPKNYIEILAIDHIQKLLELFLAKMH